MNLNYIKSFSNECGISLHLHRSSLILGEFCSFLFKNFALPVKFIPEYLMFFNSIFGIVFDIIFQLLVASVRKYS